MKKGREEVTTTSRDEKVLNKGVGGRALKGCDSDPGCGEADASSGWRQEYHHQRVNTHLEPGARAVLRWMLGRA